jgi:LemA protein
MKVFLAVLVVLGIVFTVCVSMALDSFNGFVNSEESAKTAWSQVENVYQRRADLIPNLVEAARGYAFHEQETFISVTEARAKVGQVNINAGQLNQGMLDQFQAAQGGLSSALSRLMVVVEKYPDLKANENFRALMDELAGTENRIAVERKRYNEIAQAYNSQRRRAPGNIIAHIFNFREYPYFKAEEGANKAPKINFGDLKKGGR